MADNSQVSQKKEEESVNLLSLNVVRRDGSISSFKSDKISDAIKKAFLAQTKIRNNKNKEKEQEDSIHKTVESLTHKVVSALTRRIADGDMIHIEDIQDQVELALMRDEHHKVARAYVLYREQRAASRYHTKKLKEQVGAKASSMTVTKRNGEKEAIRKLQNKGIDFIILNYANEKNAGFDVNTNHVYIYDKANNKIELSLDRKDRIAKKIIEHII